MVSHAMPERVRPIAPKRTLRERWSASFLADLVHDLVADAIDDVAAMMAYYAILALFPMLVFVVTLALLVLPTSTILEGVTLATSAMPPSARDLIVERVHALIAAADSGFAIGSALFALWGASRGTVALGTALNAMAAHRETRPWWRRQLIAIALTLAIAILILLAGAMLLAGPAAGHWAMDRFELGATFDLLWGPARWVGAGFLVMLVWAVLSRFIADRREPFRLFTIGGVIGVGLWIAISYAFGLYFSYWGDYEATYGALGGVIVFLTWLWLSNMALLLGAEIDEVRARRRCSSVTVEQPASGPG